MLSAESTDAPPAPGVEDARIEGLLARQVELEGLLVDLRAELRRASSGAGLRRPATTRTLSEEEVRALVDEVLADRSAAGSETSVFDLSAAMRDLLDPNLDDEARQALWSRLRAEGRIDTLVAEFERRAAAAPEDGRAQIELATAYFQKILTLSGPDAGAFGARGAATLERALELDESNWEARFALARHQYYAERRTDAVRNFERLIEQQSTRDTDDRHVQAYLWLGNLHLQQGNAAKAREVFEAGLEVFANHPELLARLAVIGD